MSRLQRRAWHVGRAIWFERTMCDLRQEDLATRVDISTSTLQRAERTGLLDPDLLARIATVLETTIEHLQTMPDPRHRPLTHEFTAQLSVMLTALETIYPKMQAVMERWQTIKHGWEAGHHENG